MVLCCQHSTIQHSTITCNDALSCNLLLFGYDFVWYLHIDVVPAVPPNLTEVTRQSATKITVQWEPLSLEESRGFITNYYVAISPLQNCSLQEPQRWQLGYNSTHNMTVMTVSSLDPQQSYCVAVAAVTKTGIGIFSDYITVPGE